MFVVARPAEPFEALLLRFKRGMEAEERANRRAMENARRL